MSLAWEQHKSVVDSDEGLEDNVASLYFYFLEPKINFIGNGDFFCERNKLKLFYNRVEFCWPKDIYSAFRIFPIPLESS